MATITSAGNGDWNTGATWVGGVVPTSADDVVLLHTVTADVDITVRSIFANTGILTVAASRSITCTAAGFSVNTGPVSSASGGVNITGSNITVTLNGTGTGADTRQLVRIAGNGVTLNTNMIGVVNGTTHNSDANTPSLITGNGANAIINYTGTISNNSATVNANLAAIRVSGAGCVINFLGTVTNGTYSTFLSTTDTILNFNGIMNGSNYATVQMALQTGQVNMQGVVNQVDKVNPFYSRVLNIAGQLQWNISGGNLYTAGDLTGYPPEAKVEDGTVYGPSNEFEGTMEPWDATFAQALATAQRDLQLPSILSAITAP